MVSRDILEIRDWLFMTLCVRLTDFQKELTQLDNFLTLERLPSGWPWANRTQVLTKALKELLRELMSTWFISLSRFQNENILAIKIID